MFAGSKAHGLLVSLPTGEDDIALARQSQRKADGFAPVGDAPECLTLASTAGPRAICHFLEDLIQRLGARVFRGQHREVRQLCRNLGHHPAFGFIAQPRRAKDGDDSRLLYHGAHRVHRDLFEFLRGEHVFCRFQRYFQGVRRVSEIDDRSKVLAHIDAFHTARDALQRRDASCRSLRTDFQSIHGRSQCGQAIRDVEGADQLARNRDCKIPAPRREIDSRWAVIDIHRADIRIFPQTIIELLDFDKVI